MRSDMDWPSHEDRAEVFRYVGLDDRDHDSWRATTNSTDSLSDEVVTFEGVESLDQPALRVARRTLVPRRRPLVLQGGRGAHVDLGSTPLGTTGGALFERPLATGSASSPTATDLSLDDVIFEGGVEFEASRPSTDPYRGPHPLRRRHRLGGHRRPTLDHARSDTLHREPLERTLRSPRSDRRGDRTRRRARLGTLDPPRSCSDRRYVLQRPRAGDDHGHPARPRSPRSPPVAAASR